MKSDFSAEGYAADAVEGVSVTASEAMAELQRVIDSPDFDASPRNRLFLKMVVESTVEGRQITGRQVAIQAFKRPDTFDPSKDPIVRIECSKLRKSLEMYYLKSGLHNPLRILIPKGRYRAAFARNQEHPAREDRTSLIDRGTAVLLRAAIAGWAGDGTEATQILGELRQAFPGFPQHPVVLRYLETVRGQDAVLHDLLREGLHLLERQEHEIPEALAALS